VPNRRRRKLSTAMSAVAALAVASPFAVIAVSDLTADTQPATEHHDFVRAAMVTDLPNELVTALQQGLSQFGVNLPPLPGLSPAGAPAALNTPGLAAPGLSAPGPTAPGLTPPGLTPGLGAPASLTDPALTNPALTNPALTSPGLGAPGLGAPGLGAPATGLNPALTSPAGLMPTGLGAPGEMPIAAPVPGDPLSGTYPILGDPSLGGGSGLGGGGGGLMSDLSSAASQLGVGQAIDLLKGVVMPMITSAAQSGAVPAAPAPPAT
jgi:hypothetical protein